MRIKPFSRTEMKMLIYNKVKRGMSYDDAKKQLQEEIDQIKENSKVVVAEIPPAIDEIKFRDEFRQLG